MQKVLQELNIDVKLYLGSEIYVTNNIIEIIEEQKASTLSYSRYVLFELPLRSEIRNLKTILYKLIEKGCIPIIAHPERYQFVQESPERLEELIDMGVLLQANYGSIIGLYGNPAKKTVKRLLEKNMIHFLGSDVHREKTIYPQMNEILKKIKKIVGQERLEEITTINPKVILQNRKLEII